MIPENKKASKKNENLGDYLLLDKEKIVKTLTELRRETSPCDVSDLLLKPFYEMMGKIEGRVK